MAEGDLARLFHRLTSLEPVHPGRGWPVRDVEDPWLVTSFEANDMGLLPPLAKEFSLELPLVLLPRELPDPSGSTLAVLAGRRSASGALDLAQVARLLHLSAGIVRTEERAHWPDGEVRFRAAGSAGGCCPFEVYVIVTEGLPGLPPGVYLYRPVEHALLRVAPPPAGAMPALVVTGVPWRTGWRYRERGYRHLLWDAGYVLAHVMALAVSTGIPVRLYSTFPDVELRDLVGADGIGELPVAVVTLGDGPPGWEVAERGVPGSVGDPVVHFPLVTAVHWAGISSDWGEPWPLGPPVFDSLSESPAVNAVIY